MHYQIVVCDDNKAIRDKIVKVLRTLEQEINADNTMQNRKNRFFIL